MPGSKVNSTNSTIKHATGLQASKDYLADLIMIEDMRANCSIAGKGTISGFDRLNNAVKSRSVDLFKKSSILLGEDSV
jgi:hypothetical protein